MWPRGFVDPTDTLETDKLGFDCFLLSISCVTLDKLLEISELVSSSVKQGYNTTYFAS